ncbi:MAG: pyridoxamine 5-phosphate oxidase-related FMN-binding [Frankiales bacterium]|nr:pyridoxamine 5-phosphate oxidase-related FMN-binding [Frankiales bacterium]
MATLDDPGVRLLLEEQTNHAVITTLDADGTPHSTVVWALVEDGKLVVNSAVGRRWPTNLSRDPRLTVVVYDESNPYDYVEVTGTVTSSTEGADAHIDRLAKKYMDVDSYPFRQPGEQRISFLLTPTRVRHQKQR